jgi:GT2 family glycosyltransferase
MTRLSVVIVNYNVEHFLEICLHSVMASANPEEIDVWVVDNNSSDGSLEMLRQKFPEVNVIANTNNTGFSMANNQAIRASVSEYVLLLNPDTIVPEDCFSRCVAFMDAHPEAGGLGARMVDGSGVFLPESKRGLPGPWVSFCKAFGLTRLFPNSPKFGGYYLSYLDEHQIHEIDVLSGAFMLMRRSALESSGLLDEDFFMYGEDVDLSYRIQKSGFKNFYYPEISLIHFKGESTRRGSISFVRNFYKAMLLFSAKHFSRNKFFSFFIYIGIGIRAMLALAKRAFEISSTFVFEFSIAYLGMTFIKNWWELNFKGVPGMYPDIFIQLLIPGYLLVWLLSIRITAAYSRDNSPMVVLKGIILGTILISGITNFFDDYRFSKGLILIGAAWTWSVCTARLIIHQLFKSRKLLFNLKRKKRVLISGDQIAFQNACEILSKFSQDVLICGRCGNPANELEPSYLGPADKLPELSFRLGLDELIFCQDGMTNKAIIGGVEKFRQLNIRFSILAPGGRYLVSSSEKHNRGQIMQSDSTPELLQVHNLRLKRLCDLGICLILLPVMPLIAFRVKSFSALFQNFLNVLTGSMTWIGPSTDIWQRYGLRPAVINSALLAGKNADKSLIDSLDRLYIQEFLAEHEVWTVLKNLRHLGNTRPTS